MQKNYLFLYLKTGGGHLAPARSLANYIHSHYGDEAKVSLLDGFAGVRNCVKTVVEDGYRKSQARAVWIFEALYAFHKIPLVAFLTSVLLSFYIKPHLKKQILTHKPEKIVVFHFFLIRPVMQIVQHYMPHASVMVVVTDPYTAHPIWFLRKEPEFIVFSERVKNYCIRKKIPEENIKVFPFILDEKFTRPLSPLLSQTIKENLGFEPGKRLILILGGADGIPKGEKMLKSFLKSSPAAEVAIVCGNNKGLYKKVWKLKNKYNFHTLKIYGYVDFVYELINIADVVVTKCGASTFMEVLMSGKIPVISDYIWEQEKGNKDFVCDNTMGIYEKDIDLLSTRINELIYNPHIYNIYKSNIERQQLINGTPMVSNYLVTHKKRQNELTYSIRPAYWQ
ncbi:MAG: MGDG synthase family glycosyltransferase [Bacteroidota bacterium]